MDEVRKSLHKYFERSSRTPSLSSASSWRHAQGAAAGNILSLILITFGTRGLTVRNSMPDLRDPLLLTPNNLGGTWRRICSPDIRSVSALEVLLGSRSLRNKVTVVGWRHWCCWLHSVTSDMQCLRKTLTCLLIYSAYPSTYTNSKPWQYSIEVYASAISIHTFVHTWLWPLTLKTLFRTAIHMVNTHPLGTEIQRHAKWCYRKNNGPWTERQKTGAHNAFATNNWRQRCTNHVCVYSDVRAPSTWA